MIPFLKATDTTPQKDRTVRSDLNSDELRFVLFKGYNNEVLTILFDVSSWFVSVRDYVQGHLANSYHVQ